MKTYQANKELQEILIKQGFTDCTSEKESDKGLTVFKLSKTDKKSIVIEDGNIKITPEGALVESLSENDLKIVLLYCHLITSDFKEISPKGELNFQESIENLNSLPARYALLQANKGKSTEKIKLTRVIEALAQIESKSSD